MTRYHALREVPAAAGFGKNDVLFLCGELFGRGYANGIVEEARAKGMTIIGSTVGRRDSDGTLRPLNADELAAAEELLGAKIINIPLEAGFDMEPGKDGVTPVDRLKGVKPDDWASVSLPADEIEFSRKAGAARFQENLGQVVAQLQGMIPAGARVLCVHTMAGGIPRARVFMPLLNKIFKGQGDRFVSSEAFWKSDLGKLCDVSFNEVTADTFGYLIDATASLREKFTVSYAAYGYHGCEVLINGAYTWQSYTPYLQGWAKIRLEDVALAAWEKGVKATVFNCPEIQTNSSALFLGVENSLYPLLSSLQQEGEQETAKECAKLLKEGETIEKVLAKANEYLSNPLVTATRDLATWPQHNSREQQDYMLASSAELLAMNENQKDIVCAVLSRAVFEGVGKLMINASYAPKAPLYWLNHDVIAKCLAKKG
ncbi:enoyl ACP reductase FabMG family protein [Geomesophilobacter sediminis]|uniref:Uncharacterized protein n=1 Tax=Geomesophilobacter sediminis TaxID=2798584 RepID=A0A8J7SBI6_9BACT|nr:hypothetical protein [Geomesophilobacter sediminis]MBJ6727821.1 hypothetical protein [Geomesophilobacter sediminis]